MFNISKTDKNSYARLGVLKLPHGKVKTPCFMPVGTLGAMKGLKHDVLDKLGCNLILANTYHLYLRPGVDVIKEYGNLHNFTAWNKNFLTDSGGFQVFSLSNLRKIEIDGIDFRSHIDGSRHYFTPESVFKMQEIFESDIIMALDICSSYGIDYSEANLYTNITTSWARRTLTAYENRKDGYDGLLFLITQGNFFKDLRKRSTEDILDLDSPGVAIGGISVGEPRDKYLEILEYNSSLIPKDKPKYVMGIGTPHYILDAIYYGVDIFDCVHPTRIARHGSLLTDNGILRIKRSEFAVDTSPVEQGCYCTLCTRYSRGYLRHLIKSGETFGVMLASEHNIHYMFRLIEKARNAIMNDDFTKFKKFYLIKYDEGNFNE
ncbi:tRNA guanosine(34) transglycosylase Tgt [Borrelia miyamotoi]|uniref:Queuine tRNA-ribosyltransferase n=1 Tax=Borrelia miyamotoi TaxID=47466 RepID=A0AAX3JLZ9_9SPIR|nr:tRNA guanosine(34) transglycosylase Tgt [Borrelia miyamotoi]QFP41575.1 tRNA guanosine(34) transglycosylase Tgt [Borrelia miyamotoi]QFP47695.1 tRNA guanosine(34) transglycosylase Tgt [Borrelia miyamotoi]QGT55456.1 tRNA guanosine(34) transglycosylase Tgt [Borrelia miyamotoi]QGT56239.1 tRNA guanosine(34) transglycosylase Tgt [Borrelia miyamotoi]WAZ71480.1 tRNA guanosine(34) transglycosylase Tgt [Borrelia miyamotoi]